MKRLKNHYNVLVAAVFASAAVTCGSILAVNDALSQELDSCLTHFNRCQTDLLKITTDSDQAKKLREQINQDMARMRELKSRLAETKTASERAAQSQKVGTREFADLEFRLKAQLSSAVNEMFITRDDLVQFDVIKFDLIDQKLLKMSHDDSRISLVKQFMSWHKNILMKYEAVCAYSKRVPSSYERQRLIIHILTQLHNRLSIYWDLEDGTSVAQVTMSNGELSDILIRCFPELNKQEKKIIQEDYLAQNSDFCEKYMAVMGLYEQEKYQECLASINKIIALDCEWAFLQTRLFALKREIAQHEKLLTVSPVSKQKHSLFLRYSIMREALMHDQRAWIKDFVAALDGYFSQKEVREVLVVSLASLKYMLNVQANESREGLLKSLLKGVIGCKVNPDGITLSTMMSVIDDVLVLCAQESASQGKQLGIETGVDIGDLAKRIISGTWFSPDAVKGVQGYVQQGGLKEAALYALGCASPTLFSGVLKWVAPLLSPLLQDKIVKILGGDMEQKEVVAADSAKLVTLMNSTPDFNREVVQALAKSNPALLESLTAVVKSKLP